MNIVSYANRFIKIKFSDEKKGKTRKGKRGQIQTEFDPPTGEEKATAMAYFLRKTQQAYYNMEITALKNGKKITGKSKIQPLKPIMDQDGILRVGGRLERSELDYEMKHPAIIPNESRLAKLFMNYAHRMTMHGGVQVSTHFIRQKYWIPKLRSELRNCIHHCVVCVRLNARLQDQLMSDLPADRIQIGKPFLQTGVDYAGPFNCKLVDKDGQELIVVKCWIVVFVCLKTRAIHLELVTELTSIAFIRCYERFIARRGRCQRMYSDNGTCFVGAEKPIRLAMDSWLKQSTLDHIHGKGTEWRFMAPAAPHQGGIYEAAVKSMKHHLKRVVGLQILTYDQFTTFLSQVEAILNSRPLHPLSDDPNDMQALTPGHFLVGEPLIVPTAFAIGEEPKATAGAK